MLVSSDNYGIKRRRLDNEPIPFSLCDANSEDVVRLKTRECLSSYLSEIKLADIIYFYIGELFSSQWNITNRDQKLILPLQADGYYEFIISWGDNQHSSITNANYQTDAHHQYAQEGLYDVHISGFIQGLLYNSNNPSKLIIYTHVYIKYIYLG